jgi:DNA-binding response OmpR family regulator
MRRPKNILIIEDEADIQNFISRVLELEGYGVYRAGDGRKGMDMLKQNQIDLVLLDLRLPVMDGWEVLREIKRNPDLVSIPVIVLTAIAEAMQRKKTLRMGAARYLVKPLSARSLSETITSVLRQERKKIPAASWATEAKIT